MSHFCKRYQISPNWKIYNENDPLRDGGDWITEPRAGCAFRKPPQRETASHSAARFWDTLSAVPLNRKPCPIPKPSSGTHFPKPRPSGKPIPLWAHWGMESSAPHACHGCIHERCFGVKVVVDAADRYTACRSNRADVGASPAVFLDELSARSPVKKKASRNSRLSIRIMGRSAPRAAKGYSPSTAFLAAVAMLSRSSLVGWSFAANQLSSSNLARALSGSCSSMAS